MGTTYHDTYQEAAKCNGIIWKHDAGYYAVTPTHSEADELPEPEKWTEVDRQD